MFATRQIFSKCAHSTSTMPRPTNTVSLLLLRYTLTLFYMFTPALFFVIQKHNRRMLEQEIQGIFDQSIKHCFPELYDEVFLCSPLEGAGQNKYGDYIRYAIYFLLVCNFLSFFFRIMMTSLHLVIL